MGRLLLLLFLFYFPSFSSSSSLHSLEHLCHPHQSSALLQFKNSLNHVFQSSGGDCDHVHPNTITWRNGTDCCSWQGVTCNSKSGDVTGLDLSCAGLGGEIHPNSTLFHLTHLQSLNLSSCSFEGDIPPQISHLSKLVSLDLSSNFDLKLEETTLKRMVKNTTSLREIYLDRVDMSSINNPLSLMQNWSSNLVTLSLPYTKIAGNLTSDLLCFPNLQELYLEDNHDIQVHVPNLHCNNASFLRVLDLSGCKFEGSTIPSSFSNLTHLTSLDLEGSNLIGPIPSSSSLSNLHHLSYLDLALNNFTGSIPSSLSSLQNLAHLDLQFNQLSGFIPSSLSSLEHLIYLDLSQNNLSGLIPSSLSNLKNLIHLDLSRNGLTGSIPDVLGGLTKLQTLNLRENNLGGMLPSSLFTLNRISSLDCSFNKIEGSLPKNITGFSNLTLLGLNDNLLNATIPSWCLSLTSLTTLYLENNRFTGHIGSISSTSLQNLKLCGNKLQGSIPESVFNLINLTTLCLSSENWSDPVHFPLFSNLENLQALFLSGYSSLLLTPEANANYTFPSLEDLVLHSNNITGFSTFSGKFPSLFFLDLSNNNLEGKVPKWIYESDTLIHLNLSQNHFTSIEHFPWFGLQHLDLSSNSMTGEILSIFCNVSTLEVVNLSYNNFTGTIPECLSSSLQVLDLQMNRFYGTLPSSLSMNKQLATLNLYGNKLQGQMPKSWSNFTQLEVLNLGSNALEDTFPYWLQNLPSLKVLVLRANKFYGPIPSLKTKNPFPSLIICDLSRNGFTGPLPKSFIENFQAMKHNQAEVKKDLGYINFLFPMIFGNIQPEYYNSVAETIKGISITFSRIPMIFVIIDLSGNKFEGEIPQVIGELHAVIALNLSHNSFTGHVPRSIGNLRNLESLDLSSNKLTGEIPMELTNLIYLEVLKLSNNQLVGPIPQGKQFDTFSNDSYEGNKGLCGFPLPIQCINDATQKPITSPTTFDAEDKFGFGWKPVAIGYACGTVLGIGLGSCVFWIGKPQWLVIIFGGTTRRIKRRSRGNRHARTT
ncbi:hypothetical protein PIB30_068603 [Stylosanthes scabra]|uniref:Receptor-like protein 12 n=1 Tax=Stylosanthes scabra TaxID=79078 RepID=A0ABU6VLH6_9FABA|nr:hypothetical protein [Stylosanthes scabra]